MATLEYMSKLAFQNETQNPYPYDSTTDLAQDCANYVFTGEWDSKPASGVTAVRWVNQYLKHSGFFKPTKYGPGILVQWRAEYSKIQVDKMLSAFPKRKREVIVR